MSEELNDDFLLEDEEVTLEENVIKEEELIDEVIEEETFEQTESEKVAEDFGVNVSIAEVEEIPAIITGPSYTAQEEVQSLGSVGNGAIGATKKTRAKKTTVKVDASPETVEKIAIHSDKNYYWASAGKIYRGYNIVAKEKADKWLTRTGVRLATPEEVAKEFGV